ncbi:MAG: CPCC family cysteine-rich protein [Bacteroidota bacterium]
MNDTCPCCGFMTLSPQASGSYEICHVCFWEEDLVQTNNPDYSGGANTISLKEAQTNFIKFAACTKELKAHVTPPGIDEPKDPYWKFLT